MGITVEGQRTIDTATAAHYHEQGWWRDRTLLDDFLDQAAARPDRVAATELAGEPIIAKLTTAPGNGAPIGGLKVTTEHGWFTARPSGTEHVAKVYAESFLGEAHLARIIEEAQAVVRQAVGEA